MTRHITITPDGPVGKIKPRRRRTSRTTPEGSWKRNKRPNQHERHRDRSRSIRQWIVTAEERGGGVENKLMFPKARHIKRDNNALLRKWVQEVFELDGQPTACIVPIGVCVCTTYQRTIVSGHHLLKKSRYPEYRYDPRVGIDVGAGCHDACENGIHGECTGDQFQMRILESLRGTPAWRWDFPYNKLKEKEVEHG